MTEQEVKTRKRRTLEEREADAKAELEEIQKMKLDRYKGKVTEAVSLLEAVVVIAGIPPDLKASITTVIPVLKKHAG